MARALLASLIATAVVSALIYVNVRLGFLPDFDLPTQIAAFNARLGLPTTVTAVWVVHSLVGVVVWGSVFAVIRPVLIGSGLLEGLVFGLLTFLAMMVFFMPLAGRGVFGGTIGLPFIGGALLMNLVYGAVIGATIAALEEARRERYG
jgi:hypothetical protein